MAVSCFAAVLPKRSVVIGYALFVFFICGCDVPLQPLHFPQDHGPHLDARNEWWYFTGTALTADGEILGFEVTLFKRLVSQRKGIAGVGHVAVSIPQTHEHLYSETVTSAPVTGISEGVAEVTLTNFQFRFSEPGMITVTGSGALCAVDLVLTALTEPVLHGTDGIIAMGDGMPSAYYSFPNLAMSGTISVREKTYTIVTGRSWMDHQWGNFTFAGMRWDWFSLRFDDGGALMLFRFRQAFDMASQTLWTVMTADGEVIHGEKAEVASARVYVNDNQTCAYPLDWTITVPDIDGFFSVQPLFDAQALYSDVTPDYWEGLCVVSGRMGGSEVSGFAYTELTGYCK